MTDERKLIAWCLAWIVGVVGLCMLVGLTLPGCALAGGTLNDPTQPVPHYAPVQFAVSLPADASVRLLRDDELEAIPAVQTSPGRFNLTTVGVSTGASVLVDAKGYQPFQARLHYRLADGSCVEANVPASGDYELCDVTLVALHVDPSTFTLNELAAIRGAMWSTRWDGAYGPRPGQPDNILATDFYQLYPPDERARMLAIYTSRGYTHAVTGPLSGTDCYHGQYPCHDPNTPGWFPQDGPPSQAQWEFYLDRLQEMWDAGIKPIVFIHPDGWSFEQTRDVFTPLLQQPRAQRLIRIIIPTGWEPTLYGWSSCTWALFAQWARATLPHALVGIHTVSDVDAPVGTDDRCNDDDHVWNPAGNAGGWARVVPYVHFWAIQNGPYPAAPSADGEHKQPFCDQFRADAAGSLWQRFHYGYAGWPTSSAWGVGQPIRLIAAEHTAYTAYWHNLPEADAQAWGDLAIACGADGYLDGGTMPVPMR